MLRIRRFGGFKPWGSSVSAIEMALWDIAGKAAGGSRQYVGLMGKADRMFWLSVACVAILIFGSLEIMNWFLWFVIVFSIITIFMRFLAIKKELYIKTKK
jgi:phosphatidylglycerophosphate synthase